MLAGSFIAIYFFKVNILWIILACGLAGVLDAARSRKAV